MLFFALKGNPSILPATESLSRTPRADLAWPRADLAWPIWLGRGPIWLGRALPRPDIADSPVCSSANTVLAIPPVAQTGPWRRKPWAGLWGCVPHSFTRYAYAVRMYHAARGAGHTAAVNVVAGHHPPVAASGRSLGTGIILDGSISKELSL